MESTLPNESNSMPPCCAHLRGRCTAGLNCPHPHMRPSNTDRRWCDQRDNCEYFHNPDVNPASKIYNQPAVRIRIPPKLKEGEDDQAQMEHVTHNVVISIRRFRNVFTRDGWPVYLSEAYAKISANELAGGQASSVVTVAVIGASNMGKTMLASRMFDGYGAKDKQSMDHSQSTDLINTEAFSLYVGRKFGDKTIAAHRLALLDTAGSDVPVPNMALKRQLVQECDGDQQKADEELVAEMMRQESFIRDVAFKFGQVLIIMIGQMSNRDQMMLLDVIDHLEAQKLAPKIIVVHNLRNMTYDTPEFSDYVQSIVKAFCATSSYARVADMDIPTVTNEFGRYSDADDAGKSKGNMRHCFMHEHKPDQQSYKYNLCVLTWIKNLIQSCTPLNIHILAHLASQCSDVLDGFVQKSTSEHPFGIRYRPPNIAASPQADQVVGAFIGGEVVPNPAYRPTAEEKAQNEEEEEATAASSNDPEENVKQVIAKSYAVDARPLSDNDPFLIKQPDSLPEVKSLPFALTDASMYSSVPWNAEWQTANKKALVHVHMVLPGVTEESLQDIRNNAVWQDNEHPAGSIQLAKKVGNEVETLLIQFKAQLKSTVISSVTPTVSVKPENPQVRILHTGTRPLLPVPGPNTETANIFTVPVSIHTELRTIADDKNPIVRYDREGGILTMIFLSYQVPTKV